MSDKHILEEIELDLDVLKHNCDEHDLEVFDNLEYNIAQLKSELEQANKYKTMYFDIVDKYTELIKNTDNVYWTQKCDLLEAEIDRLKEAIDYVIQICGPCEGDDISSTVIKENVIEHLKQAREK